MTISEDEAEIAYYGYVPYVHPAWDLIKKSAKENEEKVFRYKVCNYCCYLDH